MCRSMGILRRRGPWVRLAVGLLIGWHHAWDLPRLLASRLARCLHRELPLLSALRLAT